MGYCTKFLRQRAALHGNFSVVLDTGEDDMPEELASVLKENGCAIIFNDAQPGRERRRMVQKLIYGEMGGQAASR